MKQIFISIIFLSLFTHCKDKKNNSTVYTVSGSYEDTYQGTNYDETYHEDSNYKYEYRTGTSGNYNYNYDIEGYDNDGNSVNGNIDISGKYGNGYINDDNGNEKSIEVEWVDYGKLEGYDEDGNYYELEAE